MLLYFALVSIVSVLSELSLSVFVVQLKTEFHEHHASGAVYVLSMAWFREWENFVCCKTNGLLTFLLFLYYKN